VGQVIGTSAGRSGAASLRSGRRRALWRAPLAAGRVPLLLFSAGLAVRLAVWWQHRGYEPFGDEHYYYRAAVIFAQTGQYQDPPTPAWLPVQRVPLLSLLAGVLFRLAGIDLGPVNLVQIGLSLLTCWFVWRWAARLWGEPAGRWALALAVFAPTLITHPATFLYTETLYACLAAAALYLLGRLGEAGEQGGRGAGEQGGRGAERQRDQGTGEVGGEGRHPHPHPLPQRGRGDRSWLGEAAAIALARPAPAPVERERAGGEGDLATRGRAALATAALAGVAIGLTALTRSSGLALLAVALLWLALIGRRAWRRAALLGLVIAVAAALTIAPWTLRNYRAYGGFLLLDTIGAYNLWRDNALPGENPAAVLARVSNPVEQARIATERGLANLIGRPDRFLARLPATALYLWHLELDSYARGGGYFEDLTNRTDSFGWVVAADAAHLAVSGLALVGLALAPWRRGRTAGQRRLQLLLLLWILANLLSGVVFHSESRFRIPYQPQLIVFAALPLAAWPALWATARRQRWRAALAAGLLALLLAGAWSPRLLPVLQMQAWVAAGDLAGRWDRDAALAAYARAIDAFPTSDRPYIILGDARRRLGDAPGAMAAYTAALAIQPHNINAAVPLMHLYLQAGRPEEARRVLRAAGTSDTDLLAWSWREGISGDASSLDVGSGLEYGHLLNVYPPERSEGRAFRWTNGHGLVRLRAPAAGAARLVLTFNGTRLNAPPAGRVEVTVNGRPVDAFATDGSWQTRAIDLRPLGLAPGTLVQIEIRSDTFIPASIVPGNRDGRRLGVALDHIALEAG
jgi:hypothetical protein